MNNSLGPKQRLMLSVQRALVGNVTSNLAGLYAKLEGDRIVILTYFFDKPSDEDRDLIEDASGMVVGDFPENYGLETRYDLLSNINLTKLDWEWDFLRAEAWAGSVEDTSYR